MFVFTNLYQWVYNNFDDTNKIINFLYHYFFTFWYVFHTLFVCCYWRIKNGLLLMDALKPLISSNGTYNLSKEYLVGTLSPFLDEFTNNLLIFLNVGSIKQSKLLFFGCAVIWDLHLFQKIVLVLSLIDKLTTWDINFSNHKTYFCYVIMMFYQYRILCPL